MDDDFDFDPRSAPFSNLTTSLAAARYVERWIVADRKRVYGAVLKYEKLSDFDLEARTGMLLNTIRPRRGELVKAGLLRDSGKTTPSPDSKQATILWEPTPHPSEEAFLEYMRELERLRSEIFASMVFHNALTPEGKRRASKLKVELRSDALGALAQALGASQDPLLFDLKEALVSTGFDPPEGHEPSDPNLFGFD